MFNEVYDQLYKKNPDSLARKVNVAVPDPLHNKVTITENGEQDVVNYAVADIDIEDSGGGEGYMGLKGISIPVTYVFPEGVSYTAADITNIKMRSYIFMDESQIEFHDTPVGDFSNWNLPFIEEHVTSLHDMTVYAGGSGFFVDQSLSTYTGDIAYGVNTGYTNISGNGTMHLVLYWAD